MDEDHGINLEHIATVGVVALFPGFRTFIGVVGLLGLVFGGLYFSVKSIPNAQSVNLNPVCDREFFLLPSSNPNTFFGPGTVVTPKALYVREANGTGYCLVKEDLGRPWFLKDGYNVKRWYEVPSKYGEIVQQLAQSRPKSNEIDLIPIWIIGFSLALLLGVWLPATIVAYIGRRLLKNVQEEPL